MDLRVLAGVVGHLWRNRDLGRIEVAFLVATIVEWGAWFAFVVYAFGRGGPTEAGLIGFAIGVPPILVGPLAAILGDRLPRSRVMVGAYVSQAVALAGAATAFGADAPVLGYGLAMTSMGLVALTRPLVASLLPEVARSPEELTAGNAAFGVAEGLGALGGSVLAGIGFGLAGAPFVVALVAGAMLLAATLLLPTAMHTRGIELDPLQRADAGVRGTVGAIGRELGAGAAAIVGDRRLAALSGIMAATVGVIGALNVLIVIVAIDVLGLDESAAGYLAAVTGAGAVVGGTLATSLAGRERLAAPLIGSVVGFALATGAVGLWSTPLPVVIALGITGIGWSIAWVAATAMIQRLAGDNVMTRVFGMNESLQTGAEALGGLLVPVLVVTVGAGGALIALGVGLTIVALVVAPVLLRADRADPSFLRDLAVIRAVPMFAPLAGPVVERLAAGAEHLAVEPGGVVVREGDPGDRFYIVTEGRAGVTALGRPARDLEPGAGFGEIALLRNVPRTATVQALEPTRLIAVNRESFLEALTGQARSRAVAASTVEAHLTADQRAIADG